MWSVYKNLYKDDAKSISINFTGKIMASGHNGVIYLWDIEKQKEIKHLLIPSFHTFEILSFHPTKNILASGNTESIMLWDVDTCKKIYNLECCSYLHYPSFDFHPNKNIFAYSNFGWISILDIETGKNVYELFEEQDNKFSLSSISFNSSGTILAGITGDQKGDKINLWNTETYDLIKIIKIEDLRSFIFHPIKNVLVITKVLNDNIIFNDHIIVFDIEKNEELFTLKGHTHHISSLDIHPNGKILVSGSKDYTIKLWDLDIGKELITLKDHNDFVTSVKFHHNGNILISASEDRTIKLWKQIGKMTKKAK